MRAIPAARVAALAALAGALLAHPVSAAPAWYAGELQTLVAELGPVAQSGASVDSTGAALGNAESRVAALVIAAVAEDPADYAGIVGRAGAAAPGLRPGIEAAAARAYPAFAGIVPVSYTPEAYAPEPVTSEASSVVASASPTAADGEEEFDAGSEDYAFEDVLPPPDDDPFEDVNRFVFAIGDAVDTIVLKPMASVYGFIVPGPVKEGMRRVVRNLGSPADFANDLMQGKFQQGANTAGRFVINSTIGLAGFFDVAQGWGMPPHKNDFGITLATYGAGPGPYVVMPIWGPTTTRDAVGEVVDTALDPLTWLVGGIFGTAISSGKGVVQREEVIEELDQLRYGSLDYYVAVRSSLLQHRAAEVAAETGATMLAEDGTAAPSPTAAAAEDAFEFLRMMRGPVLAAALAALLAATGFGLSARAQDETYDSEITGSDEGFDDTEVDPYADSGYADDDAVDDGADGADDLDSGSDAWSDDGAGSEDDVVIEGAAEDVEDDAAAAGTGNGPAAGAAILAGDALLDWAKALPANRLDARLPAMGLDLWLRSHFGTSYPPMWSAGDCGEQSGDAALDASRDIPTCAMADGLDARGKGYEIVILGESTGGDILYNAAVLYGIEAGIAGEPTVEPLPLLGDLPHALQE